ncbi:MAG: D-alanyl-D-alanine carboxypeptidase [Alphaproteobacteria bacterium]|nr:D-alanyl-D-alanine carboxypeptidase [Alphaproteobacteria bacterium]
MVFFRAIFALFFILGVPCAWAQAPALDINAREAFILDSATNTVLFEKDADQPMSPSSMSKLMTMYMVFDALHSGRLKLTDTLPVSKHAWQQEGSRMFLKVGSRASVENLIRGVIVQSGNDAAVVLAEELGAGSEPAFADLMNAKAKELGLSESHFVNATGLPDPKHYSTARDLAILSLALLRDFPEYYHYFSERTFTYNGIKQGNRNPLLYRNMSVDGLKTGHTSTGGFGLAASSIRDGRRLVVVLNGMRDMQSRADEAAKAFDYGYREFGLYTIAKKDDILATPTVWLGENETVPIVVEKEALITLPRSDRRLMKATVSFYQPMAAPIKKGNIMGTLTITAPHMDPKILSLVAAQDVQQVGFFSRIFQKLGLLLNKVLG